MTYTNPKVSIKNMKEHGLSWSWNQTVIDPAGIEHTGSYQTNIWGEGLWVLYENSEKQIRGTAQFTLSRDRKQAYQQIRYYLIKQYRMED